MRIFIKTSSWAIWAGRLARPVIPIYLVSIAAHHIGLIDSSVFGIMFALATLLGIVALFVGIFAFGRLWYTGDHGWGMASWANLVGVGAAALLALTVLLGVQYPQTNQITTNIYNAPALGVPELETREKRTELERLSNEMAVSFPTALTRTYPLGKDEMLPILERQIAAAGWGGRVIRQVAAEDKTTFVGDVKTWLGFKDRVAIRAIYEDGQSEIDMRSASYFGVSDLGANGRRVQSFLAGLDAAVRRKLLALSRQAPLADEASSENSEN